MQIVGFNFTKIHAEKSPGFTQKGRNYAIEFTDLEKEKMDILKEAESVNLTFKYILTYGEPDKDTENKIKEKEAEISFEGRIKVSTNKEETKKFQKSWKKKQVPPEAALHINNFILKKCSTKSVILHDEIGIPDPHLRIPQLQTEKNQQ
jgi:hypothetical protein